MKTLLFFSFTILLSTVSFAKKVKFSVDMAHQVVNTTGVHIVGDFQTLAGFAGGDWISSSTPMTQEGTSTIYSIVVDIPAFQKYEYKFVNGIQFYEAEFVPYESRVGYNFNDNRWLYVDSLANDTTFVGAILFGENAPIGKKLIRYYTNMYQETLSQLGVHVLTSNSNFDTTANWMYSFGEDLYETILYADSGATIAYAFINGNMWSTMENIPSLCNVQGYRSIQASKDTLLTKVCFSSCEFCSGAGIKPLEENLITCFPNPCSSKLTISSSNDPIQTVELLTLLGDHIIDEKRNQFQLELNLESMPSGIYWLKMTTSKNQLNIQKIIKD